MSALSLYEFAGVSVCLFACLLACLFVCLLVCLLSFFVFVGLEQSNLQKSYDGKDINNYNVSAVFQKMTVSVDACSFQNS